MSEVLEITTSKGTVEVETKPQKVELLEVTKMMRGLAAAIQIGTITEVAPGGQTSVTNSGDQYNAVLNFSIVRGDSV